MLEHPDLTEPRLVYADWLSDQGEPWGEVIHGSCRLERDSPPVQGVERRRLRSHVNDLVETVKKLFPELA